MTFQESMKTKPSQMTHHHQQTTNEHPYFATVARGLEEIAAQELTALGATDVRPDFTGVHFTGDQTLLYRVNLWARTIFRFWLLHLSLFIPQIRNAALPK